MSKTWIWPLLLLPAFAAAQNAIDLSTPEGRQKLEQMIRRAAETNAAARAALAEATSFELMAIGRPRLTGARQVDTPKGPRQVRDCLGWCFGQWQISGLAQIESPDQVEILREELIRWLDAPEPTSFVMCFTPHHGVRMRTATELIDFAICYECDRMDITRHDPGGYDRVHWSGDRQVLDQLLEAHGVAPTGLEANH